MSIKPPFREEMFISPNVMSKFWVRFFLEIIKPLTEDSELFTVNSSGQTQELIKNLQDLVAITETPVENIQELIQKIKDFIAVNEVPIEDFRARLQDLEDLIAITAEIKSGAVLVAGEDGEIQYNKNGVLGADDSFSFNYADDELLYTGDFQIVGNVKIGASIVNFTTIDSTGDIKQTGSATAELADGSSLKTDAAPAADKDLANKKYVDDTVSGAIAGAATGVGTTANRPAGPATGCGYFDTTLGIPIWYDGANWINASGTTV